MECTLIQGGCRTQTLPVRYCICELSGNLYVLSNPGGQGKLIAVQTAKTYAMQRHP